MALDQRDLISSKAGGLQTSAPSRSFLESILPVIGGIGGGILGSFVTPIAGTAGGAATGSALGEALAQALSGEKDDGFDFGDIAQEGVLGGSLSLIAPAFRVGSGLARGGTAAFSGLDDLSRVAAGTSKISRGGQLIDKAAKGNLLQRVGTGAQKKGAATLLRATPSSIEKASKFGVNPIDDFANFSRQYGTANVDDFVVKGGILDDVIKSSEDVITSAKKVAGKGVRLSGEDVVKALKAEKRALAKGLGNENQVRQLEKLIKLAEKKYKSGFTLKQGLDTARAANKRFAAGIVQTEKGAANTLAAKIEANALKRIFKDAFPEVSEALGNQQTALTLKEIAGKTAAKEAAEGFRTGAGGIAGRLFDSAVGSQAISGNLAQGGLGSRALANTGNLAAAINRVGGGAGRGLAGTTASQLAPRLPGALLSQAIPEATAEDLAPLSTPSVSGDDLLGLQPSQPTTLAEALADPNIQLQLMADNLGNPEAMGQLQTLFEFASLAAPRGAGPTFEGLTADQQKRVLNVANVESALDNLEQEALGSGLFPESSQLEATLTGPFRGLIAKATDPEARAFVSQLRSRGIQIIRALGEVGNLSESEQEAAIANLPTVGDNVETLQAKLKSLRDRFAGVKQNVLSGGGLSSGVPAPQNDLASILAAQGAI